MCSDASAYLALLKRSLILIKKYTAQRRVQLLHSSHNSHTALLQSHYNFLSWLSSCRAKDLMKPIAYANLLNLSKGSYLPFFICRRSRVQALITLQGEHVNSFLRYFIEQFRTFKSFATRPCGWYRSCIYRSVFYGSTVPNFGARFRIDIRAQSIWFCWRPRIRNSTHSQWPRRPHDCCLLVI